MKNKFILCLVTVAACLFTSCGGEDITLDEVSEVLPSLVENSFALNEVYFGHGFTPLGTGSLNDVSGYYYADGSDYGLYSIDEIKDATEEVFTPAYADVLYKNAFDGINDGETTVAARYIEFNECLMQSMSAAVYDLPVRTYDFDTLDIIDSDSDSATVSVETAANGETVTVELIIVRTENMDGSFEYRLDSPTY